MGLRLTEVRSEIKRNFFCFCDLGKIAAGLYKDGNEHGE